MQKPGYFWLAYDWENLVFACTMCNDGGHKENRFPLANPKGRATPNQPDHRREKPLLIDPYGKVDPRRHIAWSSHVPLARNNSRRGWETMDVFGLDRDRLLSDARRDLLEFATLILEKAEREIPGSRNRVVVRKILQKYISDTAEYAAMMQENLGKRVRAL